MKVTLKLLKETTLIMLIIVTVLTFASCALVNKDNIDGEVVSMTEAIEKVPVMAYKAEPTNELQQIGEGIKAGSDNYFYFKIGVVQDIPIHYEDAYYHDGRIESVYQWKTSSISSNSYENSKKESIDRTTTASITGTVSTEMHADVSVSKGIASASAGVSAKAGLASTLSTSTKVSDSTSFTQTAGEILENSKTRTVKMDKTTPVGFYRYVIYSDFEVYVAMICNRETKTIQYEYFAEPIKDSMFSTFRYSEQEDFKATDPAGKLSVTEDMMQALNIDLFSEDLPGRISGYIYARMENVYEHREKRKITDSGYFGLEQLKGDTFILGIPSEYFNDQYLFKFKISVQAENTIYSGYHEIHLYKGGYPDYCNQAIDKNIAERDYGWICEGVWEKEGYTYFNWDISGEKCANQMTILFDAHGTGDDDWYVKYLGVEVEVVKK